MGIRTRQFPWLCPIKVNLPHGSAGEAPLLHFGCEVEGDDLLITRVEAEPWRHLKAAAADMHHLWLLLLVLISHGSLLLK